MELKVTPYRINQNGSLSAKERLILTMIDYYQVVNEAFEESHLWNKSKESMSFPTFRFTELIEEDWEDSTFGNYLRETRFLFVVYKFDADDTLRFRGCQFWNIPYEDLETQVRDVWEKTRQVTRDGLRVRMVNGVRKNNFPKAAENTVCHVRPHAQNAQDTYELPGGRQYLKQCFWLNNTYIYD